MRMRRVSAFAASAAIHVIALIAAVVFEARSSAAPAPPADASTASEPTVVVVESLPPSEAVTETDAPADTLGIRVDEGSATVTLPGFTFDFSKVANRATHLFPFLTGSPSLDRVTAPARSRSRSRLPNPLAQHLRNKIEIGGGNSCVNHDRLVHGG